MRITNKPVYSRESEGADAHSCTYIPHKTKKENRALEMSPASTKLMTVQAVGVEGEFEKCPQLKMEHLKTFREWLERQPHLESVKDDVYLILFLRACNFRIEKAKVTLDNFFTFRTLVPEMSMQRTTDQKDIQQCFNTVEMIVLEKLDRNGNVVVIQRLRDTDASKYDAAVAMKAISMVLEAHFYENGSAPGGILICDQKGYGLGHLARVPIGVAKKIFYYMQECVAFQIKAIHVVNANQYIEKILMFFKPFMNKQLADSIVIHRSGSFDNLHKHVPREILPSDYGGFGKSLAELHDEVVARLPLFDHVFAATDKLVVDESKRPGKAKNSEALFGMEGSFKKLDID